MHTDRLLNIADTAPERPTPQVFQQWMDDLADIMALAAQAPVQSQYPLAILRARIFPSLWYGQYLLLREQGHALAFVNWAWLEEATAQNYQHTQCYLEPDQWREGSHLWFMEILGGPQYLQPLIYRLRDRIPTGTQAYWHEVTELGAASVVLRTALFWPKVNSSLPQSIDGGFYLVDGYN